MLGAYVVKVAVIDMFIQFIADLAVLFGVQFCIIKKKTPIKPQNIEALSNRKKVAQHAQTKPHK